MNRQAELAREWAVENYPEWVKIAEGTLAADLLEKAKAAAEYILATTTPETMEGIEWVHMFHHMAGAYWEGDIPVVMIDPAGGDKTTVMTIEEECIHEADDSDLVPNGKRYKLVEVPDHPEVLKTAEDFTSAPVGTVVSANGSQPYCKCDNRSWRVAGGLAHISNAGLAEHIYMNVLRWGDEA